MEQNIILVLFNSLLVILNYTLENYKTAIFCSFGVGFILASVLIKLK